MGCPEIKNGYAVAIAAVRQPSLAPSSLRSVGIHQEWQQVANW